MNKNKKMNEKKKIQLITEYLFNDSQGTDKNKMHKFLVDQGVPEEELYEYEKLNRELNAIPEREPSKKLKTDFYEKLEEYKSIISRKESPVSVLKNIWEELWQPVMIKRLAYALTIFVFGCLAGYWYTSEMKYKTQVNSMISEIQDMQKVMMLTLIQQPSPSDRLKAISISNQISNADDKIIDALLHTLNNDPNVNVRLMAVEALYNFADNPKVRIGLIKSISKQDSPIVQVTLADVMVLLQEKGSVDELKKLLKKNNLNESVESKLKQSIELLI
jgi:hypothetical protein